MKPIYKYANLVDEFIEGNAPFSLHMCNCFCGFGGGFAQELANKVPGTLEVDKQTASGDKTKLGTYSKYVEKGKVMLNCYGQYHHNDAHNGETIREDGKPILCDYKAVQGFCKKIREDFEPCAISMPMIGSGLANGDWTVVEDIITKELIEHGFEIVVYVIDHELIPKHRAIL